MTEDIPQTIKAVKVHTDLVVVTNGAVPFVERRSECIPTSIRIGATNEKFILFLVSSNSYIAPWQPEYRRSRGC